METKDAAIRRGLEARELLTKAYNDQGYTVALDVVLKSKISAQMTFAAIIAALEMRDEAKRIEHQTFTDAAKINVENDRFLSVQKQLVEALADCKWLFEQDELKPLMSGRWGDPSVVADKVNLAILAAKGVVMKNAIRKLEAFAGGSLVQIGKGLFIVGLAYVVIWLALVGINSI